jgi:probable addiction module antidote protein
MTETAMFDAGEYLDSPEMIAAYLTAAFEDGDPALIASAISDIARVQGMTDIAEKTGLSPDDLHRALGGNAELELATVLKVLNVLGISLVAQTRAA